MGVTVILCVEEKHIERLIEGNLQRQGYEVLAAKGGDQTVQFARESSAKIVVCDSNGLAPMTHAQLTYELSIHPGEGIVQVVDLDVKSPKPPTIFGNPKGPIPPAVAVRPLDWIGRVFRQ